MVVIMTKNYFEIIDDIIDNDIIYIKNEIVLANARGHTKLSLERVVKELNSLEHERISKNKEIAKLRKREERYQGVISGLLDFLELKFNNELWWDRDD